MVAFWSSLRASLVSAWQCGVWSRLGMFVAVTVVPSLRIPMAAWRYWRLVPLVSFAASWAAFWNMRCVWFMSVYSIGGGVGLVSELESVWG